MEKLAVLVSGTGSILASMLRAGICVSFVFADRRCQAWLVAEERSIPKYCIERRDFGPTFDRAVYTDRILEILLQQGISFVAMSGFKTVLGPSIFGPYAGRIINTHPSLLPAFPGANPVADALAHGEAVTGCTVHVATERVDDGLILAQKTVAVLPGDTVQDLQERIKTLERELYPSMIKEIMSGQRPLPLGNT